VTEPAPKPLRTWRPMALWSAAILLALGLIWFAAAVVVPFCQVRSIVREFREWPGRRVEPDLIYPTDGVPRLGGAHVAARKLDLYLRLPRGLAEHKERAVHLLAYCGAPAVPALIRALSDTDPAVRRAAAAALWWRFPSTEDAIPALELALRDSDAVVREYAEQALKRIRGEEPVK